MSKASRLRKRNLTHLAGRLFGVGLLADERKLDDIIPVFMRKINGEPDIAPSPEMERHPGDMAVDTINGIAVIPIVGSLIRRPTWLDAFSGLTSYGEIADNIDAALADARVKAILLQIDSFGGEAPGCFELADKIYNARSIKPIWAVSDVDCLSAAFALGCSAERLFCDPRGCVGSIGVVAVHCERSQMNAQMGINYTVFRAGIHKADFNPYERLPAEAAARLQTSMERTRQVFVETVARNRAPQIGVQGALDTEGRWFDPEDALPLGLIDGIATYEETFSQLAQFINAPAPDAPPPEPPPPPIEEEPEEDVDAGTGEDVQEFNHTEEVSEMATLPTGTGTQPAPQNTGTQPAPQPPAPPAPPAQSGTVVDLQASESRAVQIAGLCKMAGFPASAPDFIGSGLSVAEVQQKLTDMRAEKDNAGEVSNQQPGKSGGATTSGNGLQAFVTAAPAAGAVEGWGAAFKNARAANPDRFAPPENNR